ncbi:LysM peptidoglycan-binding domain-containing protein [Nocardioides sp. Leaf307]|uniref:LysM peptidoglycan-binding domain-containing protein n=1 Tax=Nocardioides sp. Leaf307 TaxID=1736331 RepID=UPI0009E98A0F|nr:hypothetical protein [Nocardioides sp. Leaf307]
MSSSSIVRCTVVWALVAATTVALTAALLPGLLPGLLSGVARPAVWADRGFEDLLVAGCSLALLGCGWWALLATTAVVTDVLRGRAGHRTRGVPDVARRWVLAACGLALAGTTAAGTLVPATAAPGADVPGRQGQAQSAQTAQTAQTAPTAPGRGPADERLLTGLPLPERAVGTLAARLGGTAPASTTVSPGDSLWTLTASALERAGRPATPAAVAAAWPRVHEANRSVVGPDPDLIHPGQRLVLPAPPTSPGPTPGQ